ncbi:hypothetical protein SRB5_62050 [Streptomyces sp. RB5]|uniref:Mce-associated membrane protein n=1 Tax=Streptomyces smaragdinus TaxID=2585196 RepID=A0A7K0CRP2_9ACTN|nr:hypothetical protein [Streptomyces smaragdinus]MQY16013.1 hypothetical protein [Streptomyces smaragdinus]
MRLTKNPLLLAALVLAVLAAAAALWSGTSWYAAAQDSDADFARSRDDAVSAARQGVQNLNTLDYRKIDEGLANWEESATGALLEQLKGGRDAFKKSVGEAKTVTTAKVFSAALTELNEREGKANVMVAVRITVTPAEGKPQAKQSRMLGELTRTPDGWKLSALAQAPVGNTGSPAGN